MKYKEYSEEAYQSILSYVINSVRIDVDDPGIKRLYIQAARVPKFSIEYSCEDIALIMPEIEKAVWTWKKEYAEDSFFVDGGENWWMVKNKVGTFSYTTNRLFMNMCEIKGILELVKDAIDKYRVIIAVSQDFADYELLKEKCDYYLHDKKNIVVVSSQASGTDGLDKRYAQERGYRLDTYPADGETFGEADGYDCNSEMIDNADALIVFWYGVGREVKNMIETAWRCDLELHEIEI